MEAAAAGAILVVMLLSAGFAVYTQYIFIGQDRERSIATLSLQQEIETLRGMPFDNILALGPNFTFTTDGFTYLRAATGSVQLIDVYGSGNIRKVYLTVNWTSINGHSLQASLTTLMTRNGINKE